MENLKNASINHIRQLLNDKYYNYYCTVYYEYINEAIINTLKDLKNKDVLTIEDIHNNIINNYI